VHSGQIEANAVVWYHDLVVRMLIATSSAGKQREYEQLLARLPSTVKLCSLREMGLALQVRENGPTYAENARLKARAYAEALAVLTIADDSGLEVDALRGEPGLLSARYGGDGLSDSDRYRLLLHRLQGVPGPCRSARFRCVVALASPGGDIHTGEGTCEGMIALTPRGVHGFGYDPVFQVHGYACSMAELMPDEKNRISHRARAVEAILPRLLAVLASTPLSEGVCDG
jgi:XTP/dITP diphosphohydrolase